MPADFYCGWNRGPFAWLTFGRYRYGFCRDSGFPPMFSERYGYAKVYRFLGFKFQRRSA
jgi:hypothetical protein